MNILAIGAHPDDIEIGCGGALARHVESGDSVTMLIITKGGGDGVATEIREAEAYEGAKALGVPACIVFSYADTDVPSNQILIKDIEKIVDKVKPQRAYIPFNHEIHQDHRAVSYASLAALRNAPQILMYEGPSSFPEFSVNYWIDIGMTLKKKESAIRAHASQGHKEILKLEAITGMNRYRGFQCRREYAEGFKVFRLFE